MQNADDSLSGIEHQRSLCTILGAATVTVSGSHCTVEDDIACVLKAAAFVLGVGKLGGKITRDLAEQDRSGLWAFLVRTNCTYSWLYSYPVGTK